eukprot:m.72186 g.72186  ORF g.72186 m.72186 type:complete len:188 (-) comp24434_c0_seq1:329-892(-)
MALLRAKCLLLGDVAVGKSALAQSFKSDGAEYPDQYEMTIGLDLINKSIPIGKTQDTVEFHLHDIAGREEFLNLAKNVWDNPSMLALVFDTNNQASFNNLPKWLGQYKALAGDKPIRGVLIGTKIDTPATREVSTEAAEKFAESYDLSYFETSVTSAIGVDAPFERLAESYHDHYEEMLKAMHDDEE